MTGAKPESFRHSPATHENRRQTRRGRRETTDKSVAALPVVLGILVPFTALALEVGQPAPDFEAESTMGTLTLSDYKGKKHVLLAFYFMDFTGG